jgi:hypothetical protein
MTNSTLWIVAAFIVLSLGLATATVVISNSAGMTEGYIPRDERAPIVRPDAS